MATLAYRQYLLFILLIIAALTAADGAVTGVVLQNIKLDFHLTDTQLGLLTGIAFSLFYSVMGVPLARWADRGNRVAIIALTTIVWSVAVCLCGMVNDFSQLLTVRIFVAVGEAGCMPCAISLIADYFSRAERPRAMALFLQGGTLSMLMGYFGGGWLAQLHGWRTTFLLTGLPGLILGPLAWFTMKEPRNAPTRLDHPRQAPEPMSRQTPETAPTLAEVVRALWANRTFRSLCLFYALMVLFNAGVARWQPTFFVRSHGLHTGELGTWIAGIYVVGAMAGTWLGGEWSTRHAANNERLQLRAMTLAYVSLGLISPFIYLAHDRYWAFAFAAIWCIVGTTIGAPTFAIIQTLVPERMRAMAATLMLFLSNLIGVGLGPLATGALSEALQPWAGNESLRFALLALCPGYMLASWFLWQASKTVTRDLAALQEQSSVPDPSGAPAALARHV